MSTNLVPDPTGTVPDAVVLTILFFPKEAQLATPIDPPFAVLIFVSLFIPMGYYPPVASQADVLGFHSY